MPKRTKWTARVFVTLLDGAVVLVNTTEDAMGPERKTTWHIPPEQWEQYEREICAAASKRMSNEPCLYNFFTDED